MSEPETGTSVSAALGQSEVTPEPVVVEKPEGMGDAEFAAYRDFENQKTESQAAYVRKQWGGSDAGVERGLESAGYAAERLEISTEDQNSFAKLRGQVEGLETLAHMGEALRHIPEGTTPADAKVRIDELKTDAAFRERIFSGDIAAKKLWDGLKAVAFHQR